MKSSLDVIISIITIATMFAGLIWRLASIKAELDKSIDSVSDILERKIHVLELQIKILEMDVLARKDFVDYRLHGHDEQITHKFDRCWSEIGQLQNFLAKDGFIPRDRNKSKA